MRGRSASTVASFFKHSKRLLFREYIQKSLYDPTYGYFSSKESPLLQHSTPMRLSDIKSAAEYQAKVASTYASSPHGWMTPVELFSPYLSRALANRIRSIVPSNHALSVIEIGAGRGTLARDILSHWEATDDSLLPRVSYYIVEISGAMAELQRQALAKWIDRGTAKVFNADAVHWFSALRASPEAQKFQNTNCHVLGTEVLDNMPHDLVRLHDNRLEQAELQVGYVDTLQTDGLTMEWTDGIDVETMEAIDNLGMLKDQTVRKALPSSGRGLVAYLRERFEELVIGGSRDIWIPTASYQLLRAIVHAIPHASVTIGDFDEFPGALPGVNAPVVQSVNQGSAVVFDSIHSAPFGKVDIMFPTNFSLLSRGHAVLSEQALPLAGKKPKFVRRVITQEDFFNEYSFEQDKNASTCQDGYNPILQDFENASFLLIDSIG